MRSITAPAILLVCAVAAVGAVELTQENFASLAAGRTTFVKFYATWCGHCRAMKPSWDALMHEYKDDRHVLVGDCDCTGDCKSICEQNGVQGYPTLKWGNPSALEDYDGGRDFDTLKKFAEDNLKPICSPSSLDLCDADKKAEIEKLQALPAADLKQQIKDAEAKIADAESNFKKKVEKLQKKYEQLSKEKDETVKSVKNSGLGLMKAVLAAHKDGKAEL